MLTLILYKDQRYCRMLSPKMCEIRKRPMCMKFHNDFEKKKNPVNLEPEFTFICLVGL